MENSKKQYIAKENCADENRQCNRDIERTAEKMDRKACIAKEDLKDKSNEISR